MRSTFALFLPTTWTCRTGNGTPATGAPPLLLLGAIMLSVEAGAPSLSCHAIGITLSNAPWTSIPPRSCGCPPVTLTMRRYRPADAPTAWAATAASPCALVVAVPPRMVGMADGHRAAAALRSTPRARRTPTEASFSCTRDTSTRRCLTLAPEGATTLRETFRIPSEATNNGSGSSSSAATSNSAAIGLVAAPPTLVGGRGGHRTNDNEVPGRPAAQVNSSKVATTKLLWWASPLPLPSCRPFPAMPMFSASSGEQPAVMGSSPTYQHMWFSKTKLAASKTEAAAVAAAGTAPTPTTTADDG
mmetsp:Transcript_23899/g.66322  ORF Transcript_23899/g.66322 Transcript_23899/m.66322 type:complete len:302 (+) Transcript_23899:895-1800(+)